MKTCVAVLIGLFLLMLSSCDSLTSKLVKPTLPGDSAQQIQVIWNKRITKCGNNYWAYLGEEESWNAELGEYKSFSWSAVESPVSDIDRSLNHVEWVVSTSMPRGIPYRVWSQFSKQWVQEWAPTGDDGWNSTLPMRVMKKNGVITFNRYALTARI